jgi:hypothetical protein
MLAVFLHSVSNSGRKPGPNNAIIEGFVRCTEWFLSPPQAFAVAVSGWLSPVANGLSFGFSDFIFTIHES